jgi:hypothetical protein
MSFLLDAEVLLLLFHFLKHFAPFGIGDGRGVG